MNSSRTGRPVASETYYPPTCPKCGSTSGFHAVEIEEDSTGCLMLMFGGLVPYLLYDSSRHGRIECESCGFVFTPVKRLTKWDFILIAPILVAILGVLVYFLFEVFTH